MQRNKQLTSPKSGMIRQSEASGLQKNQYTFAYNAVPESESGDAYNLKNESSNILNITFDNGYRVIGHLTDILDNKTYYLLTNPDTGNSQIGYVDNTTRGSQIDDETPLEEQTQLPYSEFVLLLEDDCNQCLNFDIQFPAKKIVLKDEKCGKTLYWADNNNPDRHLNLDKLEDYKTTGVEVCGDDSNVEETCLDCDKLRIDKKHNLPTIEAVSIESGGQLERGVYEFALTYSDKLGNEIGEYVSITNPIHIFDSNNKTITNEELSERTNQAIKLVVDNLDPQYKYYKVVIIQKLLGSVSYFEEGIHPVNNKEIIIPTVQEKTRIDLNRILAQKTTYIKSEGVASSNGYLFRYGLTAEKEWNLQPISNLLGAFMRWQTVEAREDIYERGESSSLYKGYMRDEVYPLSIRFETSTGYKTALFPLVSRPATSFLDETNKVVDELKIIDNKDVRSVNENNPKCSTEERNKYWQFYNTAHDVKRCENFSTETDLVTQTTQKYCISENFDSFENGTVYLDISDIPNFTDFKTYLEEFDNNLTSGLDPILLEGYDNQAIEDLFQDIREDINCTPQLRETDKDNCGEFTLDESSQYIFLGDIENEEVALIPKEPDNYKRSRISKNNFIHRVDQETGKGKRDERYAGTLVTDDAYPFEREVTIEAEKCSFAVPVPQKNSAVDTTTAFVTNSYGSFNQADLLTDVDAQSQGNFPNKITKGALWIESEIKYGDRAFLEVPIWREAAFDDLFSNVSSQGSQPTLGNTMVRFSVYTGSCNNPALVKTYFVDVKDGDFLIEDPILKSDLIDGKFYVVADFPIEGLASGAYTTSVLNGTFGLEIRAEEYQSAIVNFEKLTLNKQQKYNIDCQFEVPVFDDCDPQPYESGKFSYWESTVIYPDNEELYNSSKLKVTQNRIPENIKSDFEDYFVAANIEGEYLLKHATDFRCKPIRHFKFPDFNVSPFMSTNLITPFSESRVYPLGITIDKEVVKSFLDIAVDNKLISQNQRDTITGFEIFRGDRRVNKSIIGKGLAFDVYDYKEKVSDEKTYFSNFPFNDLGSNDLLYSDENRNSYIKHPYSGDKNSRFTFHSPDYDYYDLSIGQELKVESYQFGNSRGRFAEVLNHPEWVILGAKSYRTANRLAVLEYSLEAAIRFVENTIQTSQNYWAVIGVSSGGNPAGAITASIATALFTAFDVLTNAIPVVGRYRYEWLRIFRDLGKPENFAYQYSAEGFYNYSEANSWYEGISKSFRGNTLRGISTGKQLKEGKYIFTEKDGKQLRVNNLDREKSIFLTFGEDYPIEYPTSYKTFDNNNIDKYGSSRSTQSDNGQCISGTSPELQKNIASPYVSLKNYVPFQYNDISSIKWLPVSKSVKLDENTDCYALFGGDIFISRYTFKRKTPLFNDTAYGLAPLTPYEYYRNSNYGYVRYYADYETGGTYDLEDILFPDFKSEYNFDCQTSVSESYIKPPSKFYLNYYGIPNFLVESEINLNLRYGKPEPRNSFYPEVGDYVDWTQEKNVSIREPNRLFYNNVYSSTVTQTQYRTLPDYYNKEEFDCIYDSPNGVISSAPDRSENDLTDPWLVFKPLDYYQFPSSYGKLIDLRGIESNQILARFENTSGIFNTINQFKDAQDATTRELGGRGVNMFALRFQEFSNTELGYGGSQTYQISSNEYGHFYPDAEKGQVFQITQGINEISQSGMKAWFKEHLPFKIKDSIIDNYADIDTDNALNGIGITMGWDSKYDRVFLTKVDYIPKQELFYCGGRFLDMDCNPIEYCKFENKEQVIQDYLSQGYRYLERDCQIIFQKYIESCTYSFEFCQFENREQQEANLIANGYSFKEQNDCTLVYEKTDIICDPNSKDQEIQDLLDQGYEYYTPVDCDYSTVQSQINNLIADGYLEISDINCTKTFEKSEDVCDELSKQQEIQDLLNQGFVEVSRNGCDILFERNTDLSAQSNGSSTAEVNLIDVQGQVNFIEGSSKGDSTAVLNLTNVSPPLLVGISEGSSGTTANIVNIQPNTFIGGVSSQIPNAQTLASVLTSIDNSYPVTESNILSFKVVGSDIEAHVNVNYELKNNCFKSNNNITYYNDLGGKCIRLRVSAFQFASNLEYAYFNGCLDIDDVVFSYCTKLSDIQFNSIQNIIGIYIVNRTLVSELDFPNLLSTSGQSFASEINPSKQTLINIPNCSSLGNSVGNNNVFLNINPSCEIVCPISLQTINSGAEDGDIAYARSRGCTITYI